MAPAPKKNPIYSGRFIKEYPPDNYSVYAGETFSKAWTMRNDGEEAWPADVRFIFTNGDDMKASSTTVSTIVKPGENYDWELKLLAPSKPGRYTAFFRMITGDKPNERRFGHKVWCNIHVMENDNLNKPVQAVEDKTKAADSIKAENEAVQQEAQELCKMMDAEEVKDVEMVVDEKKDKKPAQAKDAIDKILDSLPKPSYNRVPEATVEKKADEVPAQQDQVSAFEPEDKLLTYIGKVGQLSDKKEKSAMEQLLSMGFEDFERNLHLYKQHKGNLQVIINMLFQQPN